MNEQPKNTHAAFMEVTSKKMDIQDKRIVAIEEKIKNISSETDASGDLLTKIGELSKEISSSFSVEKFNELRQKLDKCIVVLQSPAESKVHHKHYVPKIIWIAAGLFIILALVCAGWFNTYNKLDGYIGNDSKYRYLKLDTANKRLQLYMYTIDSLCSADPDFRKNVINAESENQRNMALLQKAYQLSIEAQKLEKQAKKNK